MIGNRGGPTREKKYIYIQKKAQVGCCVVGIPRVCYDTIWLSSGVSVSISRCCVSRPQATLSDKRANESLERMAGSHNGGRDVRKNEANQVEMTPGLFVVAE